jgi:hypothetical protein
MHDTYNPGCTNLQPCLNELGLLLVGGWAYKEARVREYIMTRLMGNWMTINTLERCSPGRNRKWGEGII